MNATVDEDEVVRDRAEWNRELKYLNSLRHLKVAASKAALRAGERGCHDDAGGLEEVFKRVTVVLERQKGRMGYGEGDPLPKGKGLSRV